MLNPFPIQFLALFAYFILRFFVATTLLYLGIRHLQYRHELKHILVLSWFPFGSFSAWAFGIGEIIISLFLLVGFGTQYAALLLIGMCIKMLIMRNWFDHHTIPPKLFYVLLLGASLSLFITGAGVFAFDLPI